MSIFIKNGKYYIDYYDSTGRRHREAVGTNKRQAEQALAVRQTEILQGKFNLEVSLRNILLRDFAGKYLDYARANKRSWGRDETSLKALLPIFGDLPISRISSWSVERYKVERRRSVKEATVNREVALLKRMLTLAVQWHDLKENPIKSVKLFREDNLVERILTPEEELRLLRECASHLRPIVITALNTGMRLGEILSLTWVNVNLGDGHITVTSENSKSRRARRIPINRVLCDVLMIHPRTSELVFPSPATGGAWNSSRNPLKTAFYAACRRANIQGLRFHDLRHTFATRLVAENQNIAVISKLLGHAQITTTMRYAHSTSEAEKSAVEKLCKDEQALNGHQEKELALTVSNSVLYLENSA